MHLYRNLIFISGLLLSLPLAPNALFSQPLRWVELMQDPGAKFSETQAAFDAYWKDRPVTKGSGWKPYQRWAWYMQDRLTADGRQSGPQQTLVEFAQYLATHPQGGTNKRNSTTGNWQEMGPLSNLPINGTGQPNGMGRVNCVAFHPSDPNTIYVGAPAGGIWKSTDYGLSWTPLNATLARLGVSSIVVHPTNPNTIFIGTGDRDGGDAPGLGVYRSTDGGLTWNAWHNGMGNRTVYEILMDPTDSDIMIASTNTRIYRTTDGGANWTLALNGHSCKDIAFKPGDPNYVYAGGSNRFYRSLDNGATWTEITNGTPTTSNRIALAVSADDPNYVYLFAGNGAGFVGLYRSTNSGTSFTLRSNTPNVCDWSIGGTGTGSQSWYDHVAIGDPTDGDHLYVGGINVWESVDGGLNWTIKTYWGGTSGSVQGVHADHHAMEYSPHTGDFFLGNDGGVFFSTDGGTTWTDRSAGLGIAQVYKIGQSQKLKDLVINGYQDNGTAYYRRGSWITEIGGDGMECIIDPNDDNVMYGALYYGDIRRSTNGGASFATIAENGWNGINETGSWVTPYKLHPHNTDTMFAGYDNLWRAFDCRTAPTNGVSWVQISSFSGTSNVRDIAISRSNPDVLYLSRDGADNFYKSSNASQASPTFTSLEANLPANGTPKDIEIHPLHPDTVWIALGNNIYQSNDGGTSWTDYSGTLPNISLNTIVYDRESPLGAMYVGMDVGVYYRHRGMADWELFATNLPNTEVTELEIYYDDACRGNDMLRASTYGRGLWESDLKDPGNLPPDVCFTAVTTEPCVGQPVELMDLSSYNPIGWTWTISPATFSYVNATNANSQNPVVAFSATGTYTLTLSANNANGTDSDTKVAYINVSSSSLSVPLTEDFEGVSTCFTASDCYLTTCGLPAGWTNLTNGEADDIDWRVSEGATPSSGTGPTMDANPGTATGNYIYLESSGCYGHTAIMESECFDLTGLGNPRVIFAYHMYGDNMGSLHLDLMSDGVWTEDIMPPLVGEQGGGWQNQIIPLTAYAGKTIRLRFRGITGTGFRSDLALDDIQVDNVLPVELSAFSAEYHPTGVVNLTWETLEERNNDYFLVERSPDGELFTEVLRVEGAGNSETQLQYEATDFHPLPGRSYYRLKQTDFDGLFTYSPIVAVSQPVLQPFALSNAYPDPFSDQTQVDLFLAESQMVEAFLVNALGETVRNVYSGSLPKGKNTLVIKGESLAQGLYYFVVSTPEWRSYRTVVKTN
jgi:PKD repeat protein